MKTIRPRVKQTLVFAAKGVAMIAVIASIGLVVWGGYAYGWIWTGFGPATRPVDPSQESVPAKTLWDWLGLLIIPIVLAIGGIWFSRAERRNEQNIAEERAQEAVLEAYLAQMSDLLLNKDLSNKESKPELRAVARAWTLTVLRRLNAERKGHLLRFLYESGLILVDTHVIDLEGVNLRAVNLEGANLNYAYLKGVDLTGSRMQGAQLDYANLEGTILQEVNLEGANLGEVNLRSANLEKTNLRHAFLRSTHLEHSSLEGADLTGAHLEGANLTGAHLVAANLKYANLECAHLEYAKLLKAKLEGASLEKANYNNGGGGTKWPKGFDPIAAGALLVKYEKKGDMMELEVE